jgi:endonuclease/exonuclease/phosphatase family metal-dependent hydrolase
MTDDAIHPPLTVMTVNIHKGFTALNRRFILPELRDAVRKVGADVVFLQEVMGSHARHKRRFNHLPPEPHYEFLADSIWPQYAYGKNVAYPHGDHGNAVMSKYPILYHRNHDASIVGPEKRGMLHCVLHIPARALDVHVICVHLGLAESHRAQQLALICKVVRDEIPPDAPLVVAGDFNDWRRRAGRHLHASLGVDELFLELEGRHARSFPVWQPLLAMDRIYYRGVRPLSCQRLSAGPWRELSDHAALMGEFSIPRKRR